MPQDDPLPNNISASFRQLEAAATQLNAVSDELGKHITALDVALKRLSLGISTWVEIAGAFDADTEHFWTREIGYAKIGSKWGIALRTRDIYAYDPEDGNCEKWLFNDAPRALRVEAVDKLPELLEGLIRAANKTAEKIKAKIGHAQQVITAIKEVTAPGTESPQKAAARNLLAIDQAAALRPAPKQRK